MTKKIFVLFVLVAALFGCGSGGANKITMEKYNQVTTGMTYEQVQGILGEGTEMSRNEMAGYTTVMYMWENEDGSNMNIIFQNDAVNTKAQFGLE